MKVQANVNERFGKAAEWIDVEVVGWGSCTAVCAMPSGRFQSIPVEMLRRAPEPDPVPKHHEEWMPDTIETPIFSRAGEPCGGDWAVDIPATTGGKGDDA